MDYNNVLKQDGPLCPSGTNCTKRFLCVLMYAGWLLFCCLLSLTIKWTWLMVILFCTVTSRQGKECFKNATMCPAYYEHFLSLGWSLGVTETDGHWSAINMAKESDAILFVFFTSSGSLMCFFYFIIIWVFLSPLAIWKTGSIKIRMLFRSVNVTARDACHGWRLLTDWCHTESHSLSMQHKWKWEMYHYGFNRHDEGGH